MLPIFLNQAAHRITRLRAAREPMLDAIKLERAIVPRLLGIVRANEFKKFSVARTAAVSHDNFVVRAIKCAFSA